MARTLKQYFPMQGVNRNYVTSTQPAFTSPDMANVVPYDVLGNRARGGQRPGMNRAYLRDIGNGNPVVCMGHITVVEL